jgi:hypothetical protein
MKKKKHRYYQIKTNYLSKVQMFFFFIFFQLCVENDGDRIIELPSYVS